MEDKKRRYINVLTKRYTQTAKWKCCRLAPGIRAIPKARYKHTLTKCSWRNILVKLSNCNIVNPDKRTKSITALFNATILTQQKPYVLYAVVSRDFFLKIKQALKTKHSNFRQISGWIQNKILLFHVKLYVYMVNDRPNSLTIIYFKL